MANLMNYRLQRTGMEPLRFAADLIAESAGRHQGGRERNRWYDIRIYAISHTRYVVALEYHTQWQGELDHYAAVLVWGADKVAAVLRDYDPASCVIGYPAGEAYRERQEALLRDVTARYRAQVGEILDRDEFAAEPGGEADDGR